ncbi:DNA polymerase delta, subunit 4-domain-containing protein [Scleroderma yunnanense]
MKQGTLNFTSAKRTHYAGGAKSKKPAAAPQLKHATRKATTTEDGGEPSTAVAGVVSEDDPPATIPSKRTRDSLPKRGLRGSKSAPKKTEGIPTTVIPERETLDVEDKTGRYRRYYNEVREKMGYMDPVHANGQNKIHQMLRVFDMSSEYGPCIGMTRLERWERAETLGLKPPPEVRQILLTKEGIEKEEYVQCVLYGEV